MKTLMISMLIAMLLISSNAYAGKRYRNYEFGVSFEMDDELQLVSSEEQMDAHEIDRTIDILIYSMFNKVGKYKEDVYSLDVRYWPWESRHGENPYRLAHMYKEALQKVTEQGYHSWGEVRRMKVNGRQIGMMNYQQLWTDDDTGIEYNLRFNVYIQKHKQQWIVVYTRSDYPHESFDEARNAQLKEDYEHFFRIEKRILNSVEVF